MLFVAKRRGVDIVRFSDVTVLGTVGVAPAQDWGGDNAFMAGLVCKLRYAPS